MNVDDLKWEYKPIENPDWNYARNLFTVLKRPQGTWSQSVFSVRYKNLLAPNRDYRYQGLAAFVGKEYWKFLDCVFFGINDLELIPKKVIVFPWKCIYQYSSKNVNVDVEYYLAKVKGEGITARVLFDIKSKGKHELTVKPLVDIRNVYEQSSPNEIGWRVEDSLIATRGNKAISFKIKNSSINLKNEKMMWTYKLGSGYRTVTNDGVKFIPEFGGPVFVGELRKGFSNNEKISLVINCVNEHKINFEKNENEEKRYLEKLIKKFDCSKEVLARIIAFNRFGIQQDNLIIPEAGDFWFKQIWLRDLFEALLNSFETVMRIDEIHKDSFLNKYLKKHKSYIRKVLEWALENQDKKKIEIKGQLKDNLNYQESLSELIGYSLIGIFILFFLLGVATVIEAFLRPNLTTTLSVLLLIFFTMSVLFIVLYWNYFKKEEG